MATRTRRTFRSTSKSSSSRSSSIPKSTTKYTSSGQDYSVTGNARADAINLAKANAISAKKSASRGEPYDPSAFDADMGKNPIVPSLDAEGFQEAPEVLATGLPEAQGVITDNVTGNQYKLGAGGVYESVKTPAQQGFEAAKASGLPPPQDPGLARVEMGGFTPPSAVPPPSSPAVDQLFGFDGAGGDPILTQLTQAFTELMSPAKQKDSLVSEYKKLLKESGLEDINEELIDAQAVIEGTEDDIRAEVTAASGFATDSQVLALANARNKSLIKNYNALLATRDSIQTNLNMMMQLSAQDRQMANERLGQQMQFGQIILNYKDKMQSNAREGYNNVVKALGYDGLYQSLQNDPYALSLAERTLGLSSGQLAQASALAGQQRLRELEERELDLDVKRANITQSEASAAASYASAAKSRAELEAINNPVGGYNEKQLKALTKLNDSISKNATYAKTTSMRGYADNVSASLSQGSGVGDIAAINQFQKVIDEGAVTRDQDVKLIQGSQSLANLLQTKIKRLERGEQLSPALRKQMREAVDSIYEAQIEALNKDPYISAKEREAELYGLTLSDTILGELGSFESGQGGNNEISTDDLQSAKVEGLKVTIPGRGTFTFPSYDALNAFKNDNGL